MPRPPQGSVRGERAAVCGQHGCEGDRMKRIAFQLAVAAGLAAGLTACSTVDKSSANPTPGDTVQTKYISARQTATTDAAQPAGVVPAGFRTTGSVFETG